MNNLPPRISRYFWNADPKSIDLDRHAPAIIARLLNEGDTEAIRWLNRTYTKSQIQGVLQSRRELLKKAAVYWAKFYDVPEKEVRCLQTESPNTRSTIWSS